MKPIKKELYVTGQTVVKVTNTPGVEPEAQNATREIRAEAPAGYQSSGAAGASGKLGAIPAFIQYGGTTAGDMANARRTACAGCKHWDQKAWQKFVKNSTGPAANPAWRQTMETIKARIAMAGYGYQKEGTDLVDLDATLNAHGICRVLSDWAEGIAGRDPVFWPFFSWREATCPPFAKAGVHELPVVTPESPYGLYQPVDAEASRIGAKRYDEVLRLAQGRK